jgi:hypothetical protein
MKAAMKLLVRPSPALVCLSFVALAWGQADLSGVIDIHVHALPDVRSRSIDSIDVAKLAKKHGMRGLVLKNHHESTAAMAYIVRKEVPGIEIFGGIDLDRSVGGINLNAVEQMVLMTGGWGRVVWLPTLDAENNVRVAKENHPFVAISKNGHLLPEVLDLIALVKKDQLTLETGHSSPEECLLVVHAARRAGVQHVVVTHAMSSPVKMSIPQMQEAAKAGAYIEFVYGSLLPPQNLALADYVKAIRAVGPASCILSSDLGQPENPLHPDGLVTFFGLLRKAGISQADIDLMSKTNPARALGLN